MKKLRKLSVLAFLAVGFALVFGGCNSSVAEIAVTGVTIDPASAEITVGETKQLVANVSPSNATNKNVTWLSDNPSVATVDKDGKVKGVAVGITTITVVTDDRSFPARCVVGVTDQGNSGGNGDTTGPGGNGSSSGNNSGNNGSTGGNTGSSGGQNSGNAGSDRPGDSDSSGGNGDTAGSDGGQTGGNASGSDSGNNSGNNGSTGGNTGSSGGQNPGNTSSDRPGEDTDSSGGNGNSTGSGGEGSDNPNDNVNVITIFDPATYDGYAGGEVVEIGGVHYLKITVDGYKTVIGVNPVDLVGKTKFKCTMFGEEANADYIFKIKLADSDYADISNIPMYGIVKTPTAIEAGVAEYEGWNTVSETFLCTGIQPMVQDSTDGYSPQSGVVVYIGKITAE